MRDIRMTIYFPSIPEMVEFGRATGAKTVSVKTDELTALVAERDALRTRAERAEAVILALDEAAVSVNRYDNPYVINDGECLVCWQTECSDDCAWLRLKEYAKAIKSRTASTDTDEGGTQ